MKKEIKHTHWLYGKGPEKILTFKHPVEVETNCCKCSHTKVCNRSEEKRCINFQFGNSMYSDCESCIHHYTRFDKDKIPCFYCEDFLKK